MGYVEEDYLMRYLNQLGNVLARVLGLRKGGKDQEAIKVIEAALNDFGLKATEVYLTISRDDFIPLLTEKHKLGTLQFKLLSELLFERANIEFSLGNLKDSSEYYYRTLLLLNHLTGVERTFSFEREGRVLKIKDLLGL